MDIRVLSQLDLEHYRFHLRRCDPRYLPLLGEGADEADIAILCLRLASDRDVVVGAYVDETMRGAAAIRLDGSMLRARLAISVEDRFRGRGLGRALVKSALEVARGRGVSEVLLETGGSEALERLGLHFGGNLAGAPGKSNVSIPLDGSMAYDTRHRA
jgi:GNAT superfamily N-acetyltransferase